ncbi:5'-nucleotidase C-terminal domain-containing protein [Georgenia halophila]|uniref:5'-nucleotidase C-terminal domain-containing protein n=1 Tax=Georgenia halophila TaxID=620889 RepID=A0ABP8LG58_9MICO
MTARRQTPSASVAHRTAVAVAVGATLVALAAPVTAAPPDGAGTDRSGNPRTSKTATLLYFHDAHEIGPVLTGGQDRGGVARLATAIETVRDENPATSVVFGGDLAGGSLFGGLYKGFPMVEAFNEIGVDLANFGQHDFDFGVDNARELVGASEFPWITSNLLDAAGRPFVDDGTWTVQRVGQVRIGFIGLTDAIETTSAGDQLVEEDAVDSARAAIEDMTSHGRVDVVVAVTQHPMDVNRELVRAVPAIDAVFGEEMAEYSSVIEYEGDVPLMASEGNLGSLVRLDISKERGDYVVAPPSVVEVDHTVTPDPELLELEEHYAAEMAENLSEVLASVATPLLNPDHASRGRETALGNFVADAFRAHHGADVGWANGGGLRAEAPGPDFTVRDAYAIAPFDNKVMHVEVTGADLAQALEDGVAQVADLGGGFPQVSGMSYAYSPTASAGSRVSDVRVGGRPLDPAATYTVAVPNYVVDGGDGITGFSDADALVPASEAPSDAETIAAHARQLGVIDVVLEGRITVLP